VALYRCGRQADALAVYGRARERLSDELGIEPRQELQVLERAILRQDDVLTLQPATPPPVVLAGVTHPTTSPDRAPRARPRLRSVAMAVGIVIASVAASVPFLLRTDEKSRPPAIGVGAIDPSDGRVDRSFALPSTPGRFAVGDGLVWATSASEHTLYRIDIATGNVDTIEVGDGPDAVTVGGGSAWVANLLDGTVSRVDAATGRMVQTIVGGSRPTGIAFGEGGVWVADQAGGTLTRLDPVTGGIVSVFPMDSPPTGVTVGDGSLWVTSRTTNSLARIDPTTGRLLQRIAVGGGPDGVVAGFGKVWVANELDSTVSVVDPTRGSVIATVAMDGEPSDLAVGADAVWASNGDGGGVVRIETTEPYVGSTIGVGGRTSGVTVVDDRVWVGIGPPEGVMHRGGALRVLYSVTPPTIDPAASYGAGQPWLLQPIYDTLIAFDHVSGTDGMQLVPDLALALPTVSDGGTTYTFAIRQGIRYSDGEQMRLEDVRHGLERALALNPATLTFFSDLVGAAGCTRTPPRCDLSRGITVDDRSHTVTYHLTRPDPTFPYKMTLPFTAPAPMAIGFADVGSTPVPSTGPYTFGTIDLPSEIELVRNPYFHVWSDAARPDGFVDRIVYRFGMDPDREVSEVEAGRADWTIDLIGDRVSQVMASRPDQVHSNRWQVVDYAFLNTRVPPFDDVRVRRALNFALDRRALIDDTYGGPMLATPTCQVLPPTMPGYVRYCPYTVNPSEDGAWLGSDLARARRLVRASGTQGMRVTYWALPDEPWGAGVGRVIVRTLDRIGYRARMVVLPAGPWERRINDSRLGSQIGTGSWLADYPSASNFFDFFLSCAAFTPGDPLSTSNSAEFCRPRLDRLMSRAALLQLRDPAKANALWARIDRRVTDLAPWVAVDNSRTIDFVSERVGNYEFHPVLGILLDQLWVR
ncbi:MAG: ABC transporter substrate-binding protein, partial [Actinomycetota bacterium]